MTANEITLIVDYTEGARLISVIEDNKERTPRTTDPAIAYDWLGRQNYHPFDFEWIDIDGSKCRRQVYRAQLPSFYTPNDHLSPEAEKAVLAGQSRALDWKPYLTIDLEGRLTLQHALRNRRGQRQATRRIMEEMGWAWDNQKAIFFAELTPDNLKTVLDTLSNEYTLFVGLSRAVRSYIQRHRT